MGAMYRDTDGYWHSCITVESLNDLPDWEPGHIHRLVYVSGPYTNGDSVAHMRRAILAAEILRAKGYTPIVPHLSLIWHAVVPHDWQWWLDYDIDLLYHCDVFLRLSGESPGAEYEVDYWTRSGVLMGKPFIYTEEEYDA